MRKHTRTKKNRSRRLKKTQPHAAAAHAVAVHTLRPKEEGPHSRRPVLREAHPQRERDVPREDRVRDRDLRVVRH